MIDRVAESNARLAGHGTYYATYLSVYLDLSPDSKVANIFAPFNIQVTNIKPSSGEYSTVYIGGTTSDVGAPYAAQLDALPAAGSKLLGIGSQLDFLNSSKTDAAYVFSDFVKGLAASQTPDGFKQELAMVIAHEAGHIFGLQHVVADEQLMASGAGTFGTGIADQSFSLGYPALAFGVDFCQNTYQTLGRNVGLKDGTPLPPSWCEESGTWAGRLFAGLKGTALYGAELLLYSDDDAGPTIFNLGDVTSGSTFDWSAFAFPAIGYALIGSSILGGPIDVFSIPTSIDLSKIQSLQDINLLSLMSTFPENSSDFTIDLYRFTNEGGFTPFAVINSSLEFPPSVPEPPTILLVLLALVAANANVLRNRGYHIIA